jgi:predicted dithiol-disulfide oxidoreductase (DUF899 family)
MATKIQTAKRKQAERLEKQILKDKQRLVKLRQSQPPLEVQNYIFTAGNGKKVKLSDLFGKRDELTLIHNMGVRCAYCTMWADGFNGLRNHLSDRAAFVVVSPDDPKIMRDFAKGRGWKFPLYSSQGTSFGKDVNFESADGGAWPGVSTFFKQPDGRIIRVAFAYFGPGDDFCPTWHLFDLLPRGANKWQPRYSYK